MKRIFAITISVCLIFILMSGCAWNVHYDTFDELLASVKVKDVPPEERETRTVLYYFNEKYSAGEFQHLTEYKRLSNNISEFAVVSVSTEEDGTWYHPEGHEGCDYLIFVNNKNELSIWKLSQKIDITVVPELVVETEDGTEIYD